jgi:hypothetical protein
MIQPDNKSAVAWASDRGQLNVAGLEWNSVGPFEIWLRDHTPARNEVRTTIPWFKVMDNTHYPNMVFRHRPRDGLSPNNLSQICGTILSQHIPIHKAFVRGFTIGVRY